MRNSFKSIQKGFTLIEAIIAIFVLAFGVVGVYAAFATVINSTYNISARFTAAYLAQEGLEIARNLRDDQFIELHNNPNLPPWPFCISGQECPPCSLGCMADYKTNSYDPSQGIKYFDDTFLKRDSDGFYNYRSGTDTIFKRKITTTFVPNTNQQAVNVEVLVTWSYKGKNYSFTANEHLYNWY